MSNTKLHVGNLPFEITATDLHKFFSAAGNVRDALVMTEKHSGRSQGYGFISMANAAGAKKACASLNNLNFNGRNISVSVARPRTTQPTCLPSPDRR